MTSTTQTPVIHQYSVGLRVEFEYLSKATRTGTIEKLVNCSEPLHKPLGETVYQAKPCYHIRDARGSLFTYIPQHKILSVSDALYQKAPQTGFMPVLLPILKTGLWTRVGGQGKYGYALHPNYCYPNTTVRLEPIAKTSGGALRYRVLMQAIKTGVTVDLENHYIKDVAQANGLNKRYDADWLNAIGIAPDFPFYRNQRVGVLENGALVTGEVASYTLEWVTVKADNGELLTVRPQNVRV